MPYIYNSSASVSAGVSDNLQPIVAPPVNRYTYPWGLDLQGVTGTGNQARHIATRAILFIPIKIASTITVDRIGLMFYGANSCTDTWTYDLGLYTNNATDNYPSTQIASFGTITYEPGVTADGAQQITINQALTGNTTYWIAIGINASGNTDIGAGRTPWTAQMQGDFSMFRKRGIAGVNSGAMGISWGHSIGSYSGTLPASVTYASNSASTGICLRTPLRRSA
jgi:hypothetical protein